MNKKLIHERDERKARRGKRSDKRLLEEPNTSMPSLSSNLARGNALERFNNLTLDEHIALKLASKVINGDDDESNGMCSLNSMDSGLEEKKAGGDENPDLPSHIFIGSQSEMGDRLETSEATPADELACAAAKDSAPAASGISSTFAQETTNSQCYQITYAQDSYEERLKKKLASLSLPNERKFQPPKDAQASYEENCLIRIGLASSDIREQDGITRL